MKERDAYIFPKYGAVFTTRTEVCSIKSAYGSKIREILKYIPGDTDRRFFLLLEK